DVNIGHEQVVIADNGRISIQRRATMHADVFTEYVALAHVESCRLALVGPVRWFRTHRRELVAGVAAAQPRRPGDDHMRHHAAATADAHVGADDGERADVYVVVNVGIRMYMRERINAHRFSPGWPSWRLRTRVRLRPRLRR